jgi:hypothetical protein
MGAVDIQEIDLSPLEIDVIEYDDVILKLNERLILRPHLDDDGQLYIANDDSLGIHLYAYTRQELINDVKSEIIHLWKEYANADDETLSKDARALKYRLLNAITEELK